VTVKKFENWSTVDEFLRRTKMCQFFGPPYIDSAGIYCNI